MFREMPLFWASQIHCFQSFFAGKMLWMTQDKACVGLLVRCRGAPFGHVFRLPFSGWQAGAVLGAVPGPCCSSHPRGDMGWHCCDTWAQGEAWAFICSECKALGQVSAECTCKMQEQLSTALQKRKGECSPPQRRPMLESRTGGAVSRAL